MRALIAALVSALWVAYRNRHKPQTRNEARAVVADILTEIWNIIEGEPQ